MFEPAAGRSCIELFTARTDHEIADIASLITRSLAGDTETRSIMEDNFELHFHKAVRSRVQLTAAGDSAKTPSGCHWSSAEGWACAPSPASIVACWA